ncbi:carboxypeptidase Y inhibitor [Rhodotorula toruloides]
MAADTHSSSTVEGVREALDKGGLLGSLLIPNSFTPKVTLHATYPSFGNVVIGSTYAIDQTQDEPTVSFNAPPGQDSKFTVVLADPDAPSRKDPKWAPFRHWVLADVVPGQAAGTTVVTYMGPAPPQGTGPHRYVFLLYAQPWDHTPTLPNAPDDRPSFDVGKFAKDNELDLIGATFFYAEKK